jgi:hypothetical protein
MIEEHDELKIMLGAKPSYARDVIHYLRNQLQINEDSLVTTLLLSGLSGLFVTLPHHTHLTPALVVRSWGGITLAQRRGASMRIHKSVSRSLFTHPSDAAFTSTHSECG